MKLPPPLHRWKVTPKAAIAIQRRLVSRVCVEPLAADVNLVGGVDASVSTDGETVIAGVVVWDLAGGGPVATSVATRVAQFPYVPGLLSFREAPAVLAAVRKLRVAPDVFLFDGQGVAHPRRFGLACHAGVLMDRPSVGCAKSRLFGRHEPPGPRRGQSAPLIGPDDGSVIGQVVRTRAGVKPVFVSVGHRVDLGGAVDLVLRCCLRDRLAEPIRLAHHLVGERRRSL